MKLCVVLLAAGESRRFGRENKLLALYHGRPMIVHALETLGRLPCVRRMAVVSDAQVDALAKEAGFQTVLNGEVEQGISHSIHLGVKNAGDADAVLLCAADLPKLSRESLERLLHAFEQTGAKAACLADGEIRGNPAVFSAACFDELLGLTGDRGAKRILMKEKAVRVPCVLSEELSDADTPQALCRLEKEIGQKEK